MRRRNADNSAKARLVRRLLVVGVALSLWVGGLVYRLYQLQVVQAESFQARAIDQSSAFIEIDPRRGEILDRQGKPLAVSVPVQSLFAHPYQIEDFEEAASQLASILGEEKRRILNKLRSNEKFVYLARRLSPKLAEQVRDLKLAGIHSRPASQRIYPAGELASHVLGYVGVDNEGLAGLEYRYDEQLRGRRARVDVRVDARRRSFYREKIDARTQGNNLILTIDSGLQYIAAQVLADNVQSSAAAGGAAVVLDPETGAVLAMASYPTFDPNRYREFGPDERRNQAILSTYEPGSTFKIVSLAAVANEGLVDPQEVIDCRVGTVKLASKVFRESSHTYGDLDFFQIVAKSSNVGTIHLVLRLGEQRFYHYMRGFGFGERTGLDLPGEETGLLRPLPAWSQLSIGSLAIGQEIGVTAVQIARAVSVIANGGYLVQPHVVQRIQAPEGNSVWEPELRPRRVLNDATTQLMRSALRQVVLEGTGRSARLNGYSSAGKTGTAQKFVNGSYSKTFYVPSYAGFAPVKEPALAAVVVIDSPRNGYYASDVAAPAFRSLMERSLLYLKVPKDEPGTELPRDRSLELTQASDLTVMGQEEAADDSERVPAADSPGRTEPTEESHVIALDGSYVQIPDFTGMSLREVVRHATRLGLRLRAVGRGTAVKQNPRPGTQAIPQSEFQVIFSSNGAQQDATRRAAGGSGNSPDARR